LFYGDDSEGSVKDIENKVVINRQPSLLDEKAKGNTLCKEGRRNRKWFYCGKRKKHRDRGDIPTLLMKVRVKGTARTVCPTCAMLP
jgi:hypothetical protein